MIHTILGAGGFAGNALAHELIKHNITVRLVSRGTHEIRGTESIKGDLLSARETAEAVRGSDIVYLCVGLPYDSRVWQEMWPRVMQNTIDACKQAQAKLIFLDVVYMYGKVTGKMTEETPYKPCSKKGEIRANVATMLENEMRKGTLQALIARSADVYGPFAGSTSIPHVLVFDKLLLGKRAQWLVDAHKSHSYTYTSDCAKGMWMLSSQADAFNQVWHLPTSNPAPDGEAFIALAAKELGVSPEYSILKKPMVRFAGIFARKFRESYEMLYQSEFEYSFDSTKFEKRFGYSPKPYAEGIRETIQFLKTNY
jgi:nucleoside-diphosphate-sugar epimerase